MKKYLYTQLVIMIAVSSVGLAQQKPSKQKQDTLNTQLARQMGVSKNKAERIRNAYNYKSDEIRTLMMDTTMKPHRKQELMKQLLQERKQRINAEMTPGQLDSLKRFQNKDIKTADDHRKAMEERQLAQINKVPHQRSLRMSRTDTLKRKPDPKIKAN